MNDNIFKVCVVCNAEKVLITFTIIIRNANSVILKEI